MGQELNCTARFGKQRGEGRALLETNEIIFRGDFRLKIPFATIKSLKAVDGKLQVQTAEGLAIFELGAAAEKWREKILHPKSRLEKLGVKETDRIGVLGRFDEDFIQDLKTHSKQVRIGRMNRHMEHVFLSIESREELPEIWKYGMALLGAMALWIVYPKGKKEITENDVLAAGRKAGLKDVKVVGFSATHTGLKFVLPLNKR